MNKYVQFVKINSEARPPHYQTDGSVGADLHSAETVDIAPGDFKLVKTGLKVALPEGIEMQIRPRSGLAFKHGVTVLNAPGTIDCDYRGEVGVLLINHGPENFHIEPGDRIAQAVLNEIIVDPYIEVTALPPSDRDEGGFGSTGRN